MSNNKGSESWVDKDGIVITLEDCKEACHNAVSVMTKEFATNRNLKSDLKVYVRYKRQINILEVIRDKFAMLARQTKKVQRKTVKKRKRMIH